MRQIRTTRKRRQWAESREAVIKGLPLTYPAAAAERYQGALEKMVQQMRKDYERELRGILEGVGEMAEEREADSEEGGPLAMDANIGSQARILLNALARKWESLFTQQATRITDRMLSQVNRQSKANLGESLKKLSGGLTIPTPEMPAGLQTAITASVAENVALIKDISDQYAQRIQGAVFRSIQAGGQGQKEVYDELVRYGEMSERRAKNIALDQTRKATTAFNRERSRAVGIRKGIWRHSGGGAEPRKMHLELDGQEFDLDNPPVIDPDGTRGLPGFLPNCKCFWEPVLDFGDDGE